MADDATNNLTTDRGETRPSHAGHDVGRRAPMAHDPPQPTALHTRHTPHAQRTSTATQQLTPVHAHIRCISHVAMFAFWFQHRPPRGTRRLPGDTRESAIWLADSRPSLHAAPTARRAASDGGRAHTTMCARERRTKTYQRVNRVPESRSASAVRIIQLPACPCRPRLCRAHSAAPPRPRRAARSPVPQTQNRPQKRGLRVSGAGGAYGSGVGG